MNEEKKKEAERGLATPGTDFTKRVRACSTAAAIFNNP